MQTVSISTIIVQGEPTCKITKCTGKSQDKVCAESPLVFLLLGVCVPWRLYNANMLRSQGKGVSQAPTSSQQKSPCSALLMGSSSLAPRSSHGCAHPAGAAKFWLSTVGCIRAVSGDSMSLTEHRWGPWDSYAPLAGVRVITLLCSLESDCLRSLTGGEGLGAARGS